LAGYIDRGLAAVADELAEVRAQVPVVAEVAACLDGEAQPCAQRQARLEELLGRLRGDARPLAQHVVGLTEDWRVGLFAGGDDLQLPADNLELERWFKLPKRHARHIHGRAHAGVRLVQEGPTLLPTLNAHELHPVPFAAEDLQAYRDAPMPACQRDALHRRKVMRHARSAKQRPRLLAELERRYQNDP
jgi:hypothetical protein